MNLPPRDSRPSSDLGPSIARRNGDLGGTNGARPVAAFTIDVEDWYQSCVDYDAPITERVVRNLQRVLAVIDDFQVKATFFVQGRVAETFPNAIRELVSEGHEVQSHGYSHRPLFEMNRRELREELERSRETVEDACGLPVTAFRAQDFSIGKGNLWALETLAEVGFEVDSSVFPMQSKNYGISGWDPRPQTLELPNGGSILEVPVAVWSVGPWRVPVAGGGYFRVLPRPLLDRGLLEVAKTHPPVVYCHPYEFNETELDEYKGIVSRRLLYSQGLGRGRFVPRVRKLLTALEFGRFDDVLKTWGLR
jgi:polysaccharide deacetylase family protein (PEP-CTERM system associated)